MFGKIDWQIGPVCGQDNCKSKLYYWEDGFRSCKRGHLQEGVQTQLDEDSFGTQGRKTRIRKETLEKVSHIYRGTTAVELYLQVYQLILWKQCHALIYTVGLPVELETVVKDLWALRLQLLKNKADATSDEETLFGSQPQSETETEEEGKDRRRQYKIRGKAMPTLIETLGLLYLGMVLLRLPIGMGDIHRLAVREDIPFIRAVRFVPMIMRQRLPAEYLLALDTTSPLQPDHIRKTIHNLSLFYTHHFKMIFPPINVHVLLYKKIRDLALPITLHRLTLSVASIISVDFAFPNPKRRQSISSVPELQLISLLLIATKLYHPFSGPPRHARSLADPGALKIDWETWIAAHDTYDAALANEAHSTRGSEINVSEADAMNMTGDQLDEYMDYYERTFIGHERVEQKKHGLPKQLLDMFPTHRIDGSQSIPYSYHEQMKKEQSATEQKLKTVMGGLTVRPVTSDVADDGDKVHRIGTFYKRYRRVEDLDGAAKRFYQRVAERVGVSLETLIIAVLQTEQLLIKEGARKAKESGDDSEVTDNDEDDKDDKDDKDVEVDMGDAPESSDVELDSQ